MANLPLRTIRDHVYRTVGTVEFAGLADDELLRQAFVGRDHAAEAAFSVLLQRHGSLVYRTCYSALRDAHDAEDAFQATFLVLARKAKSLRARKCLGPWLYEVARRVSAHARTVAARRARKERQAPDLVTRPPASPDREHIELLHTALNRLPTRFRLPIILCDLEELSYREAAERLGCSLPTIRNRLARGRRHLQLALRRLGLDSTTALAAYGTIPAVPRTLLSSTASSAAHVVLGIATSAIPISVLALTHQGLQTMLLFKLKTAGLAMIATVVLIAGAYGLSGQVAKGPVKPTDPASGVAGAQDKSTAPLSTSQTGTAALVARLTGPASLDKALDGQQLKDVLDFLSERYGVTFIIDVQAFDRIGKRTVEDEQVRLPKMPGVTLDTILKHLMGQINGAIMVRHNHLEVTSNDAAVLESRSGVRVSFPEEMQPLVNIACEDRPVDKILADLSRQSGRNVILDPRVKDRERLTISVTLLNTPLDTATRLIAAMVNLQTVPIDNVIFVTTAEHATLLIGEETFWAERRKAAAVDRAAPLQPKP